MDLSPDLARKLLTRDFANLAQRVQRGGNLSRSERAMLQGMAASSSPAEATVAENYVELAGILGVTRQTIYAWRRRAGAPRPASNGYHDVVAWREFVRAHDLKAGMGPDAEVLKARKLLAEVEDRELKVSIKKGEYVPLQQVREEWTRQVGRARALLEVRFLNELPPILSGKDAVGIRAELDRVLMEVYATLHSGGTTTP